MISRCSASIAHRYVIRNFARLTGFAAGGAQEATGGGTNYQCLPLNPDEDSFRPPNTGSIISKSEYFAGDFGPFPYFAQYQNVPCAKCYSVSSAVMMVPAKSNCPIGWKRELPLLLPSLKKALISTSTRPIRRIEARRHGRPTRRS